MYLYIDDYLCSILCIFYFSISFTQFYSMLILNFQNPRMVKIHLHLGSSKVSNLCLLRTEAKFNLFAKWRAPLGLKLLGSGKLLLSSPPKTSKFLIMMEITKPPLLSKKCFQKMLELLLVWPKIVLDLLHHQLN